MDSKEKKRREGRALRGSSRHLAPTGTPPWSKLLLRETSKTDTVRIPFYSPGNQSTERLCDLPEVTQPVGGRAEI